MATWPIPPGIQVTPTKGKIGPAGMVDREFEATGFRGPKGLGVEGSHGVTREGQGPPNRAQ
eukprot:12413552-Karenia_brevis.AAC.1